MNGKKRAGRQDDPPAETEQFLPQPDPNEDAPGPFTLRKLYDLGFECKSGPAYNQRDSIYGTIFQIDKYPAPPRFYYTECRQHEKFCGPFVTAELAAEAVVADWVKEKLEQAYQEFLRIEEERDTQRTNHE